jgi:outer membrane protein assembly factor BamB
LIPAVVAIAILIFVAAPLLFKKSTSYPGPSVVEYVESQAYNVMVYELENSEGTVIWLFESPEKEISTS